MFKSIKLWPTKTLKSVVTDELLIASISLLHAQHNLEDLEAEVEKEKANIKKYESRINRLTTSMMISEKK